MGTSVLRMSQGAGGQLGQGWREFEVLAAQIYANLAPQGATVMHDDHIVGRASGIKRQIDVSIRFSIAGHEFLTVVQARDRSTPADVNSVGEFATVVDDVGASKGVLISRSGFTSSAMTLACSKGIDLCNVHDAASEKWALDIRFPILWIDLTPDVQFAGRAYFEPGDRVSGELHDWVISADGGQTRVQIPQTFERLWNDRKIPTEPGTVHRLHDPNIYSVLVRSSSGSEAWRPMHLALEYTVARRAWFGTFSPEECRGILHYNDGSFHGRFPLGAIPHERSHDWMEIDDPEELAPTVAGTLVTSEGWQVMPGSARMNGISLRDAETGFEVTAEGPEDEPSSPL